MNYNTRYRRQITLNSKDPEAILENILGDLSQMEYVHPEDFPNIDLYMDQVTTFMDGILNQAKRHSDDKLLTKTMINNYAKNRLLPSPEKKKYSKEHMMLLVFIYYLKSLLSISDIHTVLEPIIDRYFKGADGKDISMVYQEVFQMEKPRLDSLIEEIRNDYLKARETFTDLPAAEQEQLRVFSFLCILSFDVYIKKTVIEKMVDEISSAEESGDIADGKKHKRKNSE